jgi:uncharacterized protein YdaU (DUF1376 family)
MGITAYLNNITTQFLANKEHIIKLLIMTTLLTKDPIQNDICRKTREVLGRSKKRET